MDDLWRERLVARLDKLGKPPAWLAEESGCPASLLSEILSKKRHHSTYLPEIHKALGWPAPLGPLLPGDDEALLDVAHGLDHDQRIRLLERGLSLKDERKKR